MKLYFSPGACSLAPHITLRETELPFELVRVDLAAHKTQAGDDYFAITSKGMVPALELDDGTRLTEGPVIVQYVCDKAARHDLMPAAGTIARYRVMEWQNYITSELHKGFSPLLNPALDTTAKKTLIGVVRKKLEWISGQIKQQSYLTGDNFTGADAYLFTICQFPRFFGFDISDLSDLQAYLGRIAARPAVQKALKAEGLIR